MPVSAEHLQLALPLTGIKRPREYAYLTHTHSEPARRTRRRSPPQLLHSRKNSRENPASTTFVLTAPVRSATQQCRSPLVGLDDAPAHFCCDRHTTSRENQCDHLRQRNVVTTRLAITRTRTTTAWPPPCAKTHSTVDLYETGPAVLPPL